MARLGDVVASYVDEAARLDEARVEVGPPPHEPLVAELRDRLDRDPALTAAFEALTPGRRREYDLHVRGAMQAATRERRIERCVPRILEGRGLRDR